MNEELKRQKFERSNDNHLTVAAVKFLLVDDSEF